MGAYIIVSLTLSTLIYQEGGKDTCLNYGAIRATATFRLHFIYFLFRDQALYFHRSLSERKYSQFSKTLQSILVDFNNSLVQFPNSLYKVLKYYSEYPDKDWHH